MRTLLIIAALALSEDTCGVEEGNKAIGEPCTRRAECVEPLDCRGGVCAERSDGGGSDGE
ncbi:MAG: hypothetical protein AAGE52_21985 [Myxococcota bacterium]